MKHRVMTVLVAAGLLGGCSTSFLDNALEYPSAKDRKDTQGEVSVPDSPAPTTVAVAKTAPFVTVPEAPPLGSTDQQHPSLRAGTAPPTPVAVQPKVAAVPLDDAVFAPRTPPAPPVLRSATPPVAAPVARTVAPPPAVTRTVAAPAPVAVASVPPPRTMTPPPAAQPSYPAPAPAAQPRAPAPVPAAPPTYTAMAQAPAEPVAQSNNITAAPGADSWCVRVAKSAQAEAAEQGFDAATQQRRSLAIFKQCSSNAR